MDPLASVEELQTFTPGTTIDPDHAALVLDIASDTIRTYTRQTLSRTDDESLVLAIGWPYELWLPERPVIDITSITVDGALIAPSAYTWTESGRIAFPSGVSGTQASIVYSHGWDPMRADIKGVCLEMARSAVVTPDGGAVKSETVGAYSVAFDIASATVLTESQERRLLPYRPPITSVPITL